MLYIVKKILVILSIIAIIFFITSCSKNIYQVNVSDEIAKSALETAMEKIDYPYEWGGRGPDEFDCSGLITWSYKQTVGKNNIFRVGNSITNDATMDDLYTWNVTLLSFENIKEGDLIFITNEKNKVTHGGLFIKWIDKDTFQFINASSYYEKVVIDEWPIDEIKREQWFVGAGRFKMSYE